LGDLIIIIIIIVKKKRRISNTSPDCVQGDVIIKIKIIIRNGAKTIIIITRYDYNLTIMKSPKPATDTIYPHIKF
jgi:hypothetical protein